jgi:hypothetical protein
MPRPPLDSVPYCRRRIGGHGRGVDQDDWHEYLRQFGLDKLHRHRNMHVCGSQRMPSIGLCVVIMLGLALP